MTIVGFKGGESGVEDLAFWYNDDIKTRRDVVMTENLSNQPLSPISLNRAAELLRGRDAQPRARSIAGQDECRGEAAMDPDAALINGLKFGASADPFVRPKPRQFLFIRC
jgi:hypothetical protein